MSWLLNLYETYEANSNQIGVIETTHYGQEYTLLPVSHTTQNAQIEVTIDSTGEFLTAEVISKDNSNTIIPCTEDSTSRSGTAVFPHPLHDKLIYVAGDYNDYVAAKKQTTHYQDYLKQLAQWAESPYASPKVKSIFRYVRKGTLIHDLVKEKKLAVDEKGLLISKWHDKYKSLYLEKPNIFTVLAGEQESAFIRFNVVEAEKATVPVWSDKEMYDSFIKFYEQKLGNKEICYVTGEFKPSTDKHANKIRNSGDKAKLISSNDTSGFTFRGRFNKSYEVATISYDVSQKSHNALKWLINRQAKIVDGRVFLVWGNNKTDVPNIVNDSFDLLNMILEEDQTQQVIQTIASTSKETAEEFKKALKGYQHKLLTELGEQTMRINILLLDSATTGRMGVLYYRDLDVKDYFARIERWHTKCSWRHDYRKVDGIFVPFKGAPSTQDIAFAAYGSRADNKVVKGLMERMLPCIVDNRTLPIDILRSAIARASSPQSMEPWEWEKTLSITCALIKSVTEGYDVGLDPNQNDRDYLFGRLLALADILERRALKKQNENRATNAIRYMNAFSKYPERTWKTIHSNINHYIEKYGTQVSDITKLIAEVTNKIPFEKFNNEPLSGKYLLGYYSQRHAYYNHTPAEEHMEETKE